MNHIHICSFSSTDELRGKNLTYANVKAVVLKTGRFSAFEASATAKHAAIFTWLCRDPELIIDHESEPYPWTLVRLKEDVRPEPRGVHPVGCICETCSAQYEQDRRDPRE